MKAQPMSIETVDAEQVRLETLYQYGILDTPAEQAFDDIALIASRVFNTPIALIAFVDADRLWFKSRVGFDEEQREREAGSFTEADLQSQIFVKDVGNDPHLAANDTFASEIGARFYAGVPFVTPHGHAIGALIVADYISREVDEEKSFLLQLLARQVMTLLELRKSSADSSDEVLRRREEYFRTLIENGSDIITVIGLDGTIRYESPSVEKPLGYKAEDLIGKSIFELIHPDDLQAAIQAFDKERADQEELCSVEFRFRHLDDSWRTLEATCKSITDELGQRAILINSRDISERRLLEEQLRQSQKMEAIGRLAGGVAHDFNNLLTAINGYCDLMVRKLSLEDPMRKNVEEIKKAGLRATALTSQLLTFSRKQLTQPRVLNLTIVIADMERLLRRLIGEGIELSTISTPRLWNIKADAGQIQQVVMNLVINARDAMPQIGRLTIETANVELDDESVRWHAGMSPGQYVMLAVNDTGCGMDRETRERIFEPFFTTKGAGKGTGLGLSTVYGIVKQNGGHLFVYSEPEKGTTFKIYLPVTHLKETAVKRRKPTPTFLPRGNETILIVEDDPLVRNLASKVLSEQGYRVIEAADGLKALRLMQERSNEKVDLLLADLVMPLMTGRELAERLGSLRPDLKVLYTSGYSEDAHEGLNDEEIRFIQKPFTPDALARSVRDTLDLR